MRCRFCSGEWPGGPGLDDHERACPKRHLPPVKLRSLEDHVARFLWVGQGYGLGPWDDRTARFAAWLVAEVRREVAVERKAS